MIFFTQGCSSQSTTQSFHLHALNKQPEGRYATKPLRQAFTCHRSNFPTDKTLKFLNPHVFVLMNNSRDSRDNKALNRVYYYEASTLKLKKRVTISSANFPIVDMITVDSNLHIALSVNHRLGKSEIIFMNNQGGLLRRLMFNAPFMCATAVTYQKQNNCLLLLDKTGSYAIVGKDNHRQHLLAEGRIPLLSKYAHYEWKKIKTISMDDNQGNEPPDGQWIAGIITKPNDVGLGLLKKIVFYHVGLNKRLIINCSTHPSNGFHFSDAHFLLAVAKALKELRTLVPPAPIHSNAAQAGTNAQAL